jgi:hypothetical protein
MRSSSRKISMLIDWRRPLLRYSKSRMLFISILKLSLKHSLDLMQGPAPARSPRLFLSGCLQVVSTSSIANFVAEINRLILRRFWHDLIHNPERENALGHVLLPRVASGILRTSGCRIKITVCHPRIRNREDCVQLGYGYEVDQFVEQPPT